MVMWPQSPGETVDVDMLVPRERAQQRSAEQKVMWPWSLPPWWSDEDPPSEEVEREMRAQDALWAAKPEGGACFLTGGKGGIERKVDLSAF